MRHDFGPLRVGKVEAIGDRQRRGSHGADVTIGFSNRLFAAFIGVGIDIARGAVGRHGERLFVAVHAYHSGITTRLLSSIGANLTVILLPDPRAASEIGRSHQLEQICTQIRRLGDIAQRLHFCPGLIVLTAQRRAVILRGIIGERTERDIADHFAIPFEHHMTGIGHFADHREVEFPFLENRLRHRLLAGFQHHQHAFLRFGQHHFIRRHAGFALRNLIHVEPDAASALGRHFDAGAGQASRTHILDRDNRIGRHQFKAGLDQQLFSEGVANLDSRAFFLGILAKIGRRHGRTVNAVAPGFRSDIDNRIAHAGGS